MKKYILCAVLFLALFFAAHAQTITDRATLQSPDKNIAVRFYQQKMPDGKRVMYYQVSYKNKTVISPSVLDIQLDNHLSESAMALKVDRHEKWCENLVVKNVDTTSKDTTWKPVYGEKAILHDRYKALNISLQKEDNPIYHMQVQIRAYDTGVAIRYFFPENEKGTYYRVTAENTEFTLPENTKAWFTAWAQGAYSLLPLKNWPGESERPLTLQLSGGVYACLAEAQLTDYSRTKFKLSTEKPNTIVTAMHDPADLISPFATPWRVIMLGDKAGDIAMNNSIIQNLNPPSTIKNTAWIKPGKIMRVMQLTTAAAKANIDFAAKHNLSYVLFDWKWYGPAFSFSSDAGKVAIPDFDLPAIIQYGKDKGVGVWLYVNQQALLTQMDTIFPLYKKWGVKGVKFGFVQAGSHRWTTWLYEAIKKAAQNELMVNIHDDWRPTGEQRTWPNLMTAEGIRGNEEMPDATNNTVLPFTRYVAGAADYTISYLDKRIKTTHAHQLALAAIYFSPLQTLYWYDRPEQYTGATPELEFWDNIPVTWDETIVIDGAPGQYITTARRKGNDWFIGAITNNNARKRKLKFDFLPKGKTYAAKIYRDDESVTTATKVKVETRKVSSKTVLDINLIPSGGQAIWLKSIR